MYFRQFPNQCCSRNSNRWHSARGTGITDYLRRYQSDSGKEYLWWSVQGSECRRSRECCTPTVRGREQNGGALACEAGVEQLRKVSLPHQRCRHIQNGCLAKYDAICFSIPKIKYLVPPDRKTSRGSELVFMVRRIYRCIPVCRIQIGVAKVLPGVSVNLVGARLDAGTDYSSC